MIRLAVVHLAAVTLPLSQKSAKKQETKTAIGQPVTNVFFSI